MANSIDSTGRSRPLQRAAPLATLAAGIACAALQLYAGRNSPEHLVLLLITGWVVSPFVILFFLHTRSGRWPTTIQRALHVAMLFVSFASVAIYSLAVVRPLTSKPPGFLFVAVPPVSVLFVSLILAIGWLGSRAKR